MSSVTQTGQAETCVCGVRSGIVSPMTRPKLNAVRSAAARHVKAEGLRPFAKRTGVSVGRLRSVLAGRDAHGSTIEQLCRVLDLEFYVGPRRQASMASGVAGIVPPPVSVGRLGLSIQEVVRLVADAGGNPIPDDLWPTLAKKYGDVPVSGRPDIPAGYRPVDVVVLAGAAFDGGGMLDERVVGRAWFPRNWLSECGCDPDHCIVVEVRGVSMEPTLPDGCRILVDLRRRRLVNDGIFLVQTDNGLVAKRAGRGGGGAWLLLSDDPSWNPKPWPSDSEIVGQVVWMDRKLI